MLVVTLSNFGDTILTLSTIASLRIAFPEARISVVAGEKVFDLFSNNPEFHEVFLYQKKASLKEKMQFIRQLRKRRFDYVLDLRNTLIPYFIGRPSGSLGLNRRLRRIASRYERYQYLQSLLELPPPTIDALPLYTQRDHDSLLRTLHSQGLFNVQNLLVVAPGARLHLKRWPTHYFAELINKIVAHTEMIVVLVGDESEHETVQEVETKITTADVINVCGKISQKELALLVERARLILSNDSALMHMACYYKRPVCVFFGPSDETKYGTTAPQVFTAISDVACRPCEESVCQKQKQCLTSIMPDDVLPQVLSLLS